MINGPGRLHARRQVPDGADPRATRAPRARGLLDLWDRLRRRSGRVMPRSGSSRASRATTCGSSTSAASATTRAPPSYVVARASEVFEDEYKIHYPEEERPAGRPLKTDPLYDGYSRRRRDGRPRGLGAPALVRAEWPGADVYSSAAGTGSTRSARSAAPCAPASASSTRRASRSSWSRGGRRGLPRPGLRQPPAVRAGSSVAGAAPHRGGGIEADVTVTLRRAGSLLRRLRRRHRDARPRLAPATPPRGRLGAPRERHRAAMAC